MEKKIDIKDRYGNVVFSHTCENNNFGITIEKAAEFTVVLSNVDFTEEDLNFRKLESLIFEGCTFRYCSFYNAKLEGAYFKNCEIRSCNFKWTNLTDVLFELCGIYNCDFYNADLTKAEFKSCEINTCENVEKIGKESYVNIFCKWHTAIKGDTLAIGCQKRSLDEWEEFFKSGKMIQTETHTEDFKRIEAVYKAYKAYYNHLNPTSNKKSKLLKRIFYYKVISHPIVTFLTVATVLYLIMYVAKKIN